MRVGILTGMGRAFCAGADLKGVYRPDPQSLNHSITPTIYN
jgi:enoyl-CoA hydratase/carnithine racemase